MAFETEKSKTGLRSKMSWSHVQFTTVSKYMGNSFKIVWSNKPLVWEPACACFQVHRICLKQMLWRHHGFNRISFLLKQVLHSISLHWSLFFVGHSFHFPGFDFFHPILKKLFKVSNELFYSTTPPFTNLCLSAAFGLICAEFWSQHHCLLVHLFHCR